MNFEIKSLGFIELIYSCFFHLVNIINIIIYIIYNKYYSFSIWQGVIPWLLQYRFKVFRKLSIFLSPVPTGVPQISLSVAFGIGRFDLTLMIPVKRTSLSWNQYIGVKTCLPSLSKQKNALINRFSKYCRFLGLIRPWSLVVKIFQTRLPPGKILDRGWKYSHWKAYFNWKKYQEYVYIA